MIIQTQAEERKDGARFAITLDEHLQLASQFAENFGNDTFARPEPRDYFLYACRWHDKGWKDLDDNPPLDPETGLPYNSGGDADPHHHADRLPLARVQ